jgi:hypothetical protein
MSTVLEKANAIRALAKEPALKESDSLILYELLLKQAGHAILNHAYPYKKPSGADALNVPEAYDMDQISIATYLYHKLGADGEVEHDENGVNRVYEKGHIPNSLLRHIIPHVEVLDGRRKSSTN